MRLQTPNPMKSGRHGLAQVDPRPPAGEAAVSQNPAFRLHVRRSLRMHPVLAASVAGAVLVLLVLYGLSRQPVYTAESLIYVEPQEVRILSDGSASGYDPTRYDSYLQQQVQTIQREDTLEAAVRKMAPGVWSHSGESTASAAKRLGAALKTPERVLNSYQMAIDVSASSPVAAAAGANAIAEAYLEAGRKDEHARADQRLQLLSEEQARITEDMTRDKTEQASLGTSLGVANPNGEAGNPYDVQNEGLRSQLAAAHEARDVVAAQLASVSGANGIGLDTAANELIVNDPGLVSIRQTLSQRRAVLSDQMAGLTPANPVYKQDQEEINSLDRSIDRATADARLRAEHQLQEKLRLDLRRTADVEGRLNAQLAQQTAKATGAGPKLQRAAELATDLQRLTARYTTVDDAIRGLQLETGGPGQAHLALAAHVPDSPQPSRSRLVLLLALPLAILSGLGAAVFARKRDRRLYIPADVQEVLGFAPMCVLPDPGEVSAAAYDEFLLRLAGGLEGAYRHGDARSFVITPVDMPAAIGGLLPKVCDKLRQIGFRAVCVGAEELMLGPGHSLDSGTWNAVNQAELVVREGVASTQLGLLLQEYDVVLIQSPPLLGSALTEYAVRSADATILLVESAQTDRVELGLATTLLQQLNPQGIGVVLNNMPLGYADSVFRAAVRAAEGPRLRRPGPREGKAPRERVPILSQSVPPDTAEPSAEAWANASEAEEVAEPETAPGTFAPSEEVLAEERLDFERPAEATQTHDEPYEDENHRRADPQEFEQAMKLESAVSPSETPSMFELAGVPQAFQPAEEPTHEDISTGSPEIDVPFAHGSEDHRKGWYERKADETPFVPDRYQAGEAAEPVLPVRDTGLPEKKLPAWKTWSHTDAPLEEEMGEFRISLPAVPVDGDTIVFEEAPEWVEELPWNAGRLPEGALAQETEESPAAVPVQAVEPPSVALIENPATDTHFWHGGEQGAAPAVDRVEESAEAQTEETLRSSEARRTEEEIPASLSTLSEAASSSVASQPRFGDSSLDEGDSVSRQQGMASRILEEQSEEENRSSAWWRRLLHKTEEPSLKISPDFAEGSGVAETFASARFPDETEKPEPVISRDLQEPSTAAPSVETAEVSERQSTSLLEEEMVADEASGDSGPAPLEEPTGWESRVRRDKESAPTPRDGHIAIPPASWFDQLEERTAESATAKEFDADDVVAAAPLLSAEQRPLDTLVPTDFAYLLPPVVHEPLASSAEAIEEATAAPLSTTYAISSRPEYAPVESPLEEAFAGTSLLPVQAALQDVAHEPEAILPKAPAEATVEATPSRLRSSSHQALPLVSFPRPRMSPSIAIPAIPSLGNDSESTHGSRGDAWEGISRSEPAHREANAERSPFRAATSSTERALAGQRSSLIRAAVQDGPPARASEGLTAMRKGAGLRKAAVRQEAAFRSSLIATESSAQAATQTVQQGLSRRWAMLSRFERTEADAASGDRETEEFAPGAGGHRGREGERDSRV